MSIAGFGDRGSNSSSETRSLISQPAGEQSTAPEYTARLDSFDNYPPPHFVNVIHLAKSGFIFSPSPANHQSTYCVHCKRVVDSWKQGDRPFQPEFHEQGCRYARAETPSEHSGSITDISENFVRASVNSNEESTKPWEIAGTSGVPPERAEMPPLSYRGMQSQLPSVTGQIPARQAFSVPTRINTVINPPTQILMTRMRSHDEGGSRTNEVEHFQAQHHPSHSGSYGHRSFSPSPSSISSYPASSFHGSQTGSVSNLTFPPAEQQTPLSPYRQRHSSMPGSVFQSPRHRTSILENPDHLIDILGTMDMRDAQNRLYSFEQLWSEENVFRNYRLLVVCGFFCIGQGDAVECFCCHVVIANWSRNDNPRTRHIEMSPICRFMRDEECGNIPLPVERRRTARSSPRSLYPPASPSSRRSSRHSSPYSSHHSSPHQSVITQPSMEGAVRPEPSHSHHPSMEGAVGPSSVSHPSFHSSLVPVAERYSNPTNEMYQRSNLMTEFPCSNPANASMREEHARLQTFLTGEFRRQTRLMASNETLARAGLYYVGEGDKVKCWFCDGGLRDFVPQDDPWIEHAKYFPECEYLLQQRGPDWISSISIQNPNVQRPIFPRRESRILPQVVSSPTPLPPPPPRIEDPEQLEQHRRNLLEQGMQSEPAQRAREMGYSDDRISQVQWQKILLDDCTYQSAETLINALTPDMQPADSSSSSVASSGASASPQVPVIEMPDNNTSFHSTNIIGGAVINGQYYPPSSSNSSNTSNVHYSSHSTGTGLFINGQSMEQIMANAFDHPFFRGEMNHLLTPTATTIHTNPPPTVHHHHYTSPPIVRHFRPRAPVATQRSHAPTVAPPPRPPLQAINIPRRNAPRSSTPSAASTSSSTAPSTSATSPAASASTEGATSASAQNRLAELERERTCKICLNSQSVVLFRPCGHICCCEDCARRVTSCPVCRMRITQYIRTYHA